MREERLNDGNNNDQLRIANATSGGTRKAAWAKMTIILFVGFNALRLDQLIFFEVRSLALNATNKPD